MTKWTIKARRRARELILQAVYQWQLTDCDINELITQFMQDTDQQQFDVDYFAAVLTGIIQERTKIDAKITPILDRSINELNPVELAVLRLSVYELLYQPDIPYRVIINEALELAKKFGAVEGYKYVNGVLDKLAKDCRQLEVNSR